MDRDQRLQTLNETFDACAPLFRDTALNDVVLARYKIGLFLREPTFCDATYKSGGFVAPHRFLIISSNARCLDQIAPTPWGLCVWQRNSVFKIIDHIQRDDRRQITLLEIPVTLLDFFCRGEIGELIETSFVDQARATFEASVNSEPLPELNTDDWRDRLIFPIGINDEGRYFPLFPQEADTNIISAAIVRDVLHHQSQIHLASGDYDEAAPLLQQAREIRTPSDSLSHGSILLTLSDLQFEIDDLKSAEDTLLEAFAEFKAVSDNDNRSAISATLLRLGHLYQTGGALDEAERSYLHALSIRRAIGDSNSISSVLTGLGALYERMGKYGEAQSALDEAVALHANSDGECVDAILLNNTGRIAQARGDHVKAVNDFQRALKVSEQGADGHSRTRANLLYNLAEALCGSGEPAEALEVFKSALEIDRLLIREVALIASERQLQQHLTTSQFRVHQCISLILRYLADSEGALEFATKLVFERKALGFDLHVLRKLFAKDGAEHGEAHALIEERGETEARARQRELLESKIASLLPLGEVQRRLEFGNWRQVSNCLPPHSVFVEFLRLNTFDFEAIRARGDSPQGSKKYIAIVIDASAAKPQILDLGDAHLIDQAIHQLRFQLTGEREPKTAGEQNSHSTRGLELNPTQGRARSEDSRELRKLILDPLSGAFGNAKHLLLSPDGDLCRFPFEVLQFDDGSRAIDRYLISYLTCGNDLLRMSARSDVEIGTSLIVVDPDFEAGSDTSESATTDTAVRGPFARLPETRAEGEAVAQMTGGLVVSGENAVKSIVSNCQSPLVLHLATHGFVVPFTSKYLNPGELKVGDIIVSDKAMVAIRNASSSDALEDGGDSFIAVTPARMLLQDTPEIFARLSGKGILNPMLRAGVALAGANTWLRGGQELRGGDDGVLTAAEISGMDLAGTELVVLSACETGLGDIVSGEGVLGLRRSFAIAGARSLVVSLWKVPDTETRDLMIEFYSRLVKGEARAEALRGAQLAIRRRNADPFYWAAFICQGDPSTMIFPLSAHSRATQSTV